MRTGSGPTHMLSRKELLDELRRYNTLLAVLDGKRPCKKHGYTTLVICPFCESDMCGTCQTTTCHCQNDE